MKTNIGNLFGRVADEFINNHTVRELKKYMKLLYKVNRKECKTVS